MVRRHHRRGRRRVLKFMSMTALAGLGVTGVGVLACGAPVDPGPVGIPSVGGWSFPRPNPVIKAGDFLPRALWNDPHVMRVGDQYLMYMTTSVSEPFKPPVLPFRATSPDGFAWTLAPATPLLSPAGTPFASLETPSVVRFRGQWHMFVTGVFAKPNPAPFGIGHAVSDDGIVWRVTPQPVITATGNMPDWNGFLVGEPGAIVWKDRILVYFSAVGARQGGGPSAAQTIGLAVTTDGVKFSAPRRVLQQSQTYPPGRHFAGYSTPMAFAVGNRLHLVYDVAISRSGMDPEWQQVALHHAVAIGDGESEFQQDEKPLLTRDDFPWTGGEIRSPSVLVEGDTLRMWFAGHARRPELGALIRRGFVGSEFGIGYATRPVATLQG